MRATKFIDETAHDPKIGLGRLSAHLRSTLAVLTTLTMASTYSDENRTFHDARAWTSGHARVSASERRAMTIDSQPVKNFGELPKELRVIVRYVSTDELINLQRRYGARIDRRDIRQSHRRGFSILKTNRDTGAQTCEIYLPAMHRPRAVDDEGTLTLGHELLHCMRGDYHR
jgi:hypothetical protein